MSVGIEAFLWGIGSAISLPLGALLGIWWKPKQKINSAFMAFGAGALLFALTIELFGHVPHHVHEHGYMSLLAALVGALAGGALFDTLNSMLNNQGAYMRKLSSAKDYLLGVRREQKNNLVEQLGKIKILSKLNPDQMAELVSKVNPITVPKGRTLFTQGDVSDSMYFIVEGSVEIVLHDTKGDKSIALLTANDTFGELGVVSDQARSADAVTKSTSYLFQVMKTDVDNIISKFPELKESIDELIKTRVEDLAEKAPSGINADWKKACLNRIDEYSNDISLAEVVKETAGKHATGGAAIAIWLGLLIDGIPESLVIGMLHNSTLGMSLAFIAGVFLANLPEAMSSSVTMNKSGMNIMKIMMMWGSICLLTGIGAYLGATVFPSDPQGNIFYFVLGIEGLAAGAMLTMIAETMLPEAFEQGGAIVGLSTLGGFLSALVVKVL
ncbi:MAG: cyclic nucleotide-binding domain-containing protein [Bdellovibrionales bacterium]|nr:cyclic nucleotide-binding domain-containing protein [Bdellovibrionales bacterium]